LALIHFISTYLFYYKSLVLLVLIKKTLLRYIFTLHDMITKVTSETRNITSDSHLDRLL